MKPTPGSRRSFVAELKDRHVLRVAAIYIVAAIATIEAAALLFPRLDLPDTAVNLVIGLAIVGLPIALALSWTYELTPAVALPLHAPVEPPAALPVAAAAAPGDRRAVAVLPFSNLSADPEHGFFSDGVTEDILTHLSKIKALRVTSRTSVLRYKGTTKSVREIAGELQVSTVLEGSVRVAGDRVRVVAQLIDAETDDHVWAETYDRKLDDVFAVQSEIAGSVAHALAAELTSAELQSIHTTPTDNVQAYALCLKGMSALQTWLQEDLEAAVNYFEAALRIDPDYARAHAGLGVVLAVTPAFSGRTPERYHERTRAAADRALELDPTLGHGHMAKAYALWTSDWDWCAAEKEVMEALRLEPDDPYILNSASFFYVMLGRLDEAERYADRALTIQVNAGSTASMRAVSEYYRAGWGAGDFRKPLRRLDAIVTSEPTYAVAHIHRAILFSMIDRLDDCLDAIETALRFAPDVPLSHGVRGLALARLGRTAELEKELKWFESRSRRDHYAHALALFGTGDLDRVFDVLERAAEERSFFMPFLRLVPRYKPLWGHPRYLRLMARVFPGNAPGIFGEFGWHPGDQA